MHCGMRKPRKLKVRCYAAHLIDLNYYFDSFPGSKSSDKIGETELHEILSKNIPNGLSKKEYVQGFDCEPIT